MSAAIRAKTASARATIAARILKHNRTLGRSFDDCFEMFDGKEVKRILLTRASTDPELIKALRAHNYNEWADEAEQQAAQQAAPSLF